MRRLGAGRARPASAASCRGDLLDCRLRSETFPMLPSQMTDEASVILRRRPAALRSASRPHQRARSDVVATAALIRRQRPSQSGMLLHSIRPEPTVAADRQPGTRPEDDRQLHPAHPAATATALRRPSPAGLEGPQAAEFPPPPNRRPRHRQCRRRPSPTQLTPGGALNAERPTPPPNASAPTSTQETSPPQAGSRPRSPRALTASPVSPGPRHYNQ